MKKITITLETFESNKSFTNLHDQMLLEYENFNKHRTVVMRNNDTITKMFHNHRASMMKHFGEIYSKELFDTTVNHTYLPQNSKMKGLSYQMFKLYDIKKASNDIYWLYMPLDFTEHRFGGKSFVEYVLKTDTPFKIYVEGEGILGKVREVSNTEFEEAVKNKILQLITSR